MAKLKRMMPSGISGLWKALMPKKNWQVLGGWSGEACDPTGTSRECQKEAGTREGSKSEAYVQLLLMPGTTGGPLSPTTSQKHIRMSIGANNTAKLKAAM